MFLINLEGYKLENCSDCGRKRPLDELIRKYAPRYLPHCICVDCLAESQQGMFYPPLFPLGDNPTLQQKSRLRKVLNWALG